MSFIFNKGIFNSYNVKKKMAESPLQYLKFKKSDERIVKGYVEREWIMYNNKQKVCECLLY